LVIAALSSGVKISGRELTTHPHLVPRSRILYGVLLLPHTFLLYAAELIRLRDNIIFAKKKTCDCIEVITLHYINEVEAFLRK
jgi:hypothetical protein